MNTRWVLSCEHGGLEIPAAYASYFTEAAALLQSHRGWDPGALQLFNTLAPLADFSHSSTVSRLLIELNRSLHHPHLFSAFTRILSLQQKQEIIEAYYIPYRVSIEAAIAGYLAEEAFVYHLSIHSFTPVLAGDVRKADIGLLYDPGNPLEKECCRSWKPLLQDIFPDMVVRYNYPYKGTADGFTTYLRKQYPDRYAGIEFELNQKWAGNPEINAGIAKSIKQLQNAIKH